MDVEGFASQLSGIVLAPCVERRRGKGLGASDGLEDCETLHDGRKVLTTDGQLSALAWQVLELWRP